MKTGIKRILIGLAGVAPAQREALAARWAAVLAAQGIGTSG